MKRANAAVLLANDGDAPNPAVAWTACDLARRTGAKLYVVHVAGPPCRATGDALSSRLPAYSVLATLVAQCANAGGLVARANLRLGTAEAEILAEAEETGAGLIVIAGRDGGSAQPRTGDDLGEHLSRRAPCPVQIVRESEPGDAPVRMTTGGIGATRPDRAGVQRAVAR